MRKIVSVIFYLAFAILTLAAICGAGYVIYKIVISPWFWKLGLVFAVFFLFFRYRRKT